MKRIDTSTRALNLFGAGKDGFKDGDLANGLLPTDLNAAWFNMVQEELANVIEALGLTLSADGSDRTQLLNALKGRLIATRVFSSTTVYDPTIGTRFIRLRLAAPGGAGGGATATGANAVSAGVGGGSGAYLEAILTTGFAGQTIVIGAAGAPVIGASGGSGGSCSFAGLTAQGGSGGFMFGPGAVPLTAGNANTAVASGGYLQVPGQQGGSLLIVNLSAGLSGQGGSGIWGAGGAPNNVGAGNAGTGWGSGGSGAIVSQNSGAQPGGAGRPGLCVIEEFA